MPASRGLRRDLRRVYIYIYIYAKSHSVYAKAYASVTVSKCPCLIFPIDFFTTNKKNKGSEERGSEDTGDRQAVG